MMRQGLRIAAALSLLLAGCTYFPDERTARVGQAPELQEQYARSVPTCSSDEECAARWAAAKQWVMENCGALRSYSETVIDGGGQCRVTKTKTHANGYLIEIRKGMTNPLANKDAGTRQVDFNLYVKRAWPPAQLAR